MPALESASGKKKGSGFDVCFNPEFLREGSSLKDFYSPPFTLIGADTEGVTATTSSLYSGVKAPLYTVSVKCRDGEIRVATLSCVKVSFANEMEIFARTCIDVRSMDVFGATPNATVSYYLKPGFAVALCLPQGLGALS